MGERKDWGTRMSPDEIQERYEALRDPPEDADKGWFQGRGYAFERLLNALLERDGLNPRTSYKPKGEQIDGSFLCDGRVFLLEAKWHADPVPASTIYQFKGKIEGKLVGTLGVFISMAGYTTDCIDALVLGKSLNVLLLDQDDVDLAVPTPGAFGELMRLRMREAAETGSIYRSSLPDELTTTPYAAPVILSEGEETERPVGPRPTGRIVILCEGRSDSMILYDLAFSILKENGLKADIQVIQAGGKQNLPRVANLFAAASDSATVVLVADSDGDIDATKRLVFEGVAYDRYDLVTPDPSIESWLFEGDKVAAATARARQITERIRRRTKKTEEQLDALDLAKLQTNDKEFARFYEVVKSAGKAPNKSDAGDA